jgi:DNA-binding GntR family transcriptional regulator
VTKDAAQDAAEDTAPLAGASEWRAEPGRDLTLVQRITEALTRRIVSGALAPGTPLRQDHVAAEFDASHVPVREAFRNLEAQGLVTSEPRRGVRVTAIDRASIVEATEMRTALEALALRHAISRMGSGDIAKALAASREAERSRSILVFEAANRRFHQALIAPCGMPRLLGAIADLHRVSARFLFAVWRDLDWRERSETEHRAILEAAQRGDADAAAALLARHITAAGEALVAALR